MKHPEPGALYTDTCPCHTDCDCGRDECMECEKDCREDKVKVFELALIQAKVTYNRYGWHDPQGRFFANTQLNTVFFHDHLFANSHQQHGVFGALIVEEASNNTGGKKKR